MVRSIALTVCLFLLLGVLCIEAQRDGRRRTNRRKPTTEMPPPVAEPEKESNPQKLDVEPESISNPSSAQPVEPENKPEKQTSADAETVNANQSGPPFIVPRGTRKPRPHMRNNGVAKPRPTLPTFARKRGPKSERRNLKKVEESTEGSHVPTSSSTTTTAKPRGSSRTRNFSDRRNASNDKIVTTAGDSDIAPISETPETPTKKRYGGGPTRRSRGNRRYNPTSE